MDKRTALAIALVFTLLAGGCNRGPGPGVVPDDAGPDLPDSGPTCANPCGASCCGETQVCNPATLLCEIPACPETGTEFCERLGAECGSITAPDKCGEPRTWNCGACPGTQRCDDQNHCADLCPSVPDAQLCQDRKVACGPLDVIDPACGDRTIDCGSCPAGFLCERGFCLPCTPESDATFCSRVKSQCGPTSDLDNCGFARRVETCGKCDAPEFCGVDRRCGLTGPVVNDQCPGATVIPLKQNAGSVAGDTTYSTASGTSAGCGGSGRDVVYKLILTEPAKVDLYVSTVGKAWHPIVFVRSDCSSQLDLDELACADRSDRPNPQRLQLKVAAPGTYYIWIKGRSELDFGAFSINVQLGAPRPAPSNDNCRAPKPLNFVGNVAADRGDTSNATDDSGGCGDEQLPGGDVVYSLTLATESSITARVTRDGEEPDFWPVVYLRSACLAAGSEKLCAHAVGPTATLQVPRLAAGTYYLFVDGSDFFGGFFDLMVTKAPPLPLPDCSDPIPVQLTSGVTRNFSADTSYAANDASSARCGPSPGNDFVYAITTTEPGDFSATLSFTDRSVRSRLYLRTACGSATAANEIACDDGFPSSNSSALRLPNLPAGTYYLWVDTASGKGRFNLKLATEGRAQLNDDCRSPEAIPLDPNGDGAVSGSFWGVRADVSSTCSPSSARDLVYSFTTNSERSVQLVLTPTAATASYQAVVSLRELCQYDTELPGGCAAASSPGNPAELSIARLPAGIWYVWVEGVGAGDQDTFNLQINATDPPQAPANTRCSGAKSLTFDASGSATETGDTTLASSSTTGTCADATGPELVYTFTLQQAQKVTATATSLAAANQAFQPIVYLRNRCDSAAASAEQACSVGGPPTTLVVNRLPTGTWYLWVDSESHGAGAFTLTVRLDPPEAGPANESCATAQPLDLTSGSATVSVSLLNAANDSAGSCGGDYGGDVVYSLHLDHDSRITITSTPPAGTNFRPYLYLRRSCGSRLTSDELGCDRPGPGQAFTVPYAPAGTYYLWVDESFLTGRTYGLTVNLDSPGRPPPNDTCAGAEALDPFVIVQGDTTNALDDYGSGPLSGACDPNEFSWLPGKDVVYSYTPTQSRYFTVTVDASFNAVVLWATAGSCGGTGSTCVAASDWRYTPRTLTVAGSAGTTYYVVVDAANREGWGTFSLRVE